MSKVPSDAEVIRALTDLRKRIFCHGTTSKALEGMKQCGITPRDTNGCRASIWEGEKESRLGRVYVSDLHRVTPVPAGSETKRHNPVNRASYTSVEGRSTAGMMGSSICIGAAEQAVKKLGGEQVVLEITGLEKLKSKLTPDEDMEKAFTTPISENWWKYIQSKEYGKENIRDDYTVSAEERKMPVTQHTCEWILAGAHERNPYPQPKRKVVNVLGYDAHPGLWNIHSDTHVPSLGQEDVELLQRLRDQPPDKAKAQIRRVCKKLPPWYHSMLSIGTVAVGGQIPERNIRVRYAVPPKELEDKITEEFLKDSRSGKWAGRYSERPSLLDFFTDATGVPLKQWHKRKRKYFLHKSPEK